MVIHSAVMEKLTLHRLLPGICLSIVLFQGGAQIRAESTPAPELLVVNQRDRTVSVIDPITARQTAIIPEGETTTWGHEVAVSPDGRTGYVPIYSNTGVGRPGIDGREMLIIDIPARKVIGHVDFGHAVRPHCAIYDPVSGLLFVTTELDKTVTILDPQTLKIVGTIPTEQEQSHMLVISHNGRRGYTANVGPGTVSVLDMRVRKTIAVIPNSGQAQRVSISKDDSMVFTPDQHRPRLAVIDTSTNTIKAWVRLPSLGFSTASTEDGRWLLVAMKSVSQVAVVDVSTLKVVRTLDVPGGPQEIVMGPDGQVAYVSCIRAGQVAIIDLSKWKVQSLVDVGGGADGLAWSQ